MKRRKFIQSTVVASALPLTYASSHTASDGEDKKDKALIELRTYEIKFGGNQKLLLDYLNEVLHPAMKRAGATHFMVFTEMGNEEPKKIWVLISYKNADAYLKGQDLRSDEAFVKAAKTYDSIPANAPVFNRFTSSLSYAFDGMPQLTDPIENASLFELRIYEGYSEDAVRRKIKMFNTEEIPLFFEVGLHPVFFGDMISGPYRPSLVYLLNFKDMEERNANWSKFIKHPDWNTMKAKEEYANSISNIRKIFLTPT